MSSGTSAAACKHLDDVRLHVLDAGTSHGTADLDAHVAQCEACRAELETLRTVLESFIAWPTHILRPAASLWERIELRIAEKTCEAAAGPPKRAWTEPDWWPAAPGISVKLLAADAEHDRVSMLVRLDPGTDYPAHRHAGIEELHLLDGVLRVDDKLLRAGDYLRSLPGTADSLVRSETGCTCVLITSTLDELR